jgi:hypothetical protein
MGFMVLKWVDFEEKWNCEFEFKARGWDFLVSHLLQGFLVPRGIF